MHIELFEMFSGIGTLTRSLIEGLEKHIPAKVVGCVELESRYLKIWSEQHPDASTIAGSCGLYHPAELSVPKAADAIRLAVFGVPCTGASQAGRVKNALAYAEDHPDVGHLFLYVAHYIRRHSPDVVVFENVIPYVKTFSAQALRETLKGMGYHVCEREVDPYLQFGAPTQRKRWALIASRIGAFEWTIDPQKFTGTIEHLLDPVSPADTADEYSPAQVAAHTKYCDRKKAEGHGFNRRLLDRTSTKVPTIPKSYAKQQSTGIFVRSGTSEGSYRMLRPAEVARIHGFSPDFVKVIEKLPKTVAFETLGQGVVSSPFRALGEALGFWVASGRPDQSPATNDAVPYAQLELGMVA